MQDELKPLNEIWYWGGQILRLKQKMDGKRSMIEQWYKYKETIKNYKDQHQKKRIRYYEIAQNYKKLKGLGNFNSTVTRILFLGLREIRRNHNHGIMNKSLEMPS